jgi:hypothetical protein
VPACGRLDGVDLIDVAQELYGLEPGEFTTARNERAKQLKGQDAQLAARVKALAKPTTAAWLVNQLVRLHGDEVEQVAQIGAALREAQESLGSGELLALNKQRHGVLRAVTQQGRALARRLGHPVSTAIADEVEQTLRAVMSDADAARAVRTGTLLRSLSGTGLGSVDLTGAFAVPDAGAGRRTPPKPDADRGSGQGRSVAKAPTSQRPSAKDELAERRRQHEREERERERAARALAEARRLADEADAAAATADEALGRTQASVDELAAREKGLAERLRDLEQQVRDAQTELSAVQHESRSAQRDRDQARHESEVAHRAADRARHQVDRLT